MSISYKTDPTVVGGACRHLLTLHALSGSTAKLAYIKIINTNQGEEEQLFFYLLKILLDPQVVLGLKVIQPTGVYANDTSVSASDVKHIINRLTTTNINSTVRTEVDKLLANCAYSTSTVLREVLQKTLKLGVTSISINKIIPGFIPELACMLADSPSNSTVSYPARLDVKYDGVRAIAKVYNDTVVMMTRQGKLITLPVISNELLKLAGGSNVVFDGELELISGARTGISGLINSNIQSGHSVDHDTKIKYTIFDCIDYSEFNERTCSHTQKERGYKLSLLFTKCMSHLQNVFEGKFMIVNSEAEVNSITNSYIQDGLEGTILKNLDGKYEYKRSKNWIKYKAVNSCTLECVGVTEGTNKRKGKIGALVCKSSCGNLVVNVGGGMTDQDINFFTQHTPVGKFIEVLFNCVIQDDKGYSLFLPRLAPEKVRIDKTEADSLEKILLEHIGKPQLKE